MDTQLLSTLGWQPLRSFLPDGLGGVPSTGDLLPALGKESRPFS